jgi:hypothetical protein
MVTIQALMEVFFMLIDLKEIEIVARVNYLQGNRARLTITFPRTDVYRERVLESISNLLNLQRDIPTQEEQK